ncbi:hypothetical protein TNCV_4627441 [Trichonephila clavipes]|nr:hypothetical protein TNCV_4627441 [Trichonephila clavipes]
MLVSSSRDSDLASHCRESYQGPYQQISSRALLKELLRTGMHGQVTARKPLISAREAKIRLQWGSERIKQGYTPEIMDEILTTDRDLELEVNEDDIEELIMGHEDELTTEELQEILSEEHQ